MESVRKRGDSREIVNRDYRVNKVKSGFSGPSGMGSGRKKFLESEANGLPRESATRVRMFLKDRIILEHLELDSSSGGTVPDFFEKMPNLPLFVVSEYVPA